MERCPTPAVCHNITTMEEEPAENLGMTSAGRKVHSSGTVIVPVREADVCKVHLHRNESDPMYGTLADNHSDSGDITRLEQSQELMKWLYNIKTIITDCLSSSWSLRITWWSWIDSNRCVSAIKMYISHLWNNKRLSHLISSHLQFKVELHCHLQNIQSSVIIPSSRLVLRIKVISVVFASKTLQCISTRWRIVKF